MNYILLKVIDRYTYYEFYTSNDLAFLKEMRNVLNEKDDEYFYFIVKVIKDE